MLKNHRGRLTCQISVLVAAMAFVAGSAVAQEEINAGSSSKAASKKAGKAHKPKKKPDYPPFEKVSEGFTKVVSTADGGKSLYTIWTREKDGQMLAELPRNIEKQNLYIATTISAGIPTAGIQAGTVYARWKKYDKRLALLEPNLEIRTTGDQESKSSHRELFTDRMILDVPIIAKGPSGGYVIDLDELLIGKAKNFFGGMASGINSKLVTIAKAKAFSQNVEISVTAPIRANNNRLTTFSYSFSVLPEHTGYKPRKADPRVGFFATAYQDLAKVPEDDSYTRYINRWKLEKADPKLKLSPPKEPIVFYIDHTVPIRYRRWVREGILGWNKAFEKIGIINAIEVYQQDATSGAHMEKDPEDVRYNFLVWDSNGAGFAIGPSRVDPRTGQILDADVVMNDGWLRFSASQWASVIPQDAMENFGPETYDWLNTHPQWDPRIRLLPVSQQAEALRLRKIELASGGMPFGGHPAANTNTRFIGDDPYDGLSGQISQVNGYCSVTNQRGMDLAMARAGLLPLISSSGDDDDEMLDGAPEWFVGAMLKDVIAHEIGHTLGLRHNFKASTIYTMEEINSEKMKGKAFTGSVMDYNSINIQYGDLGDTQAAYFMPTIGPYDYFAIQYGYTAKDKDLKEILSHASEKQNSYGTDEDTWGPDPTSRRRDMGGNPLEFEKSMVALVQDLREKIIDRVMEDGDSWMKVRSAYGTTIGLQFRTVSNAANWVGGTYINRDRKGDPGDRDPVVPVEPKLQREALKLVIDNAFNDDAFGLTPELLSKMGIDKWFDPGAQALLFADPPFDVHDTILSLQSVAMTMLLNPTTLKRVYDLEYRVDANDDALTIPELLYGVTDAAWSELDNKRSDKRYTARKPMISSLRRNLQGENLDRLIDLTMPGGMIGAAAHPIKTLAAHKLRELKKKIARVLETSDSKIDQYTVAHLEEAGIRIEKALDASYIYNTNAFGSGGGIGGRRGMNPGN